VNGAIHRLRSAARLLRTPADAWLTVRMLAWAVILPALTRRLSLDRLAAVMWSAARGDARREPARERRVALLTRASHRAVTGGRRDNCLERSLLAYRHLSAVNARPVLLVGARSAADGTVEGHAWVTVDGKPVHDRPEDLATYVPLAAFGVHGHRQPVG
jgi:hypothetical protein